MSRRHTPSTNCHYIHVSTARLLLVTKPVEKCLYCALLLSPDHYVQAYDLALTRPHNGQINGKSTPSGSPLNDYKHLTSNTTFHSYTSRSNAGREPAFLRRVTLVHVAPISTMAVL